MGGLYTVLAQGTEEELLDILLDVAEVSTVHREGNDFVVLPIWGNQ